MMLMAERQLKILGMIQDNGSVQVDELARKLDVSPMTIRRLSLIHISEPTRPY